MEAQHYSNSEKVLRLYIVIINKLIKRGSIGNKPNSNGSNG